MNTMYRAACGVVTGARHLRASRNGQDAAATVLDGDIAVAVVCDGCSSGSSSEVGSRLGVRLFARSIADRLCAGGAPSDPRVWSDARMELAAMLRTVVTTSAGGDAGLLHDEFLFTIVAGA